jgi:hypothetical protein
MKKKPKLQPVVKNMDIIGEILPEDNFNPYRCHRRIKIAGGRGVKWPKGLIKRLYHFQGDKTAFRTLSPGTIVCIEECIEMKSGRHRCLRTLPQSVITILHVENEPPSSTPLLQEAVI